MADPTHIYQSPETVGFCSRCGSPAHKTLTAQGLEGPVLMSCGCQGSALVTLQNYPKKDIRDFMHTKSVD